MFKLYIILFYCVVFSFTYTNKSKITQLDDSLKIKSIRIKESKIKKNRYYLTLKTNPFYADTFYYNVYNFVTFKSFEKIGYYTNECHIQNFSKNINDYVNSDYQAGSSFMRFTNNFLVNNNPKLIKETKKALSLKNEEINSIYSAKRIVFKHKKKEDKITLIIDFDCEVFNYLDFKRIPKEEKNLYFLLPFVNCKNDTIRKCIYLNELVY